MARQSETLKAVFGEPQFDPPPYPTTGRSSRATSEASSQYQLYKALPEPPPQYTRDQQPTASMEQLAMPKDSLILVTASNSWQGKCSKAVGTSSDGG